MYYVHDVFYGADGVFIVWKVLGKFRLVVRVFIIAEVFLKSYVKWFTCLSDIILIAVRAS